MSARVLLRGYDRALDALAAVAAFLILAIMVGVGLDVALRSLLNSPIGWMLEFTEHSLLCILAFGMPWLVRERGHVAIELLVDAMPPRAAAAMRAFAWLLASASVGLLAYWAVVSIIEDYARGIEKVGIYPVPRFLLFSVLALGLVLTSIEGARSIWRSTRLNPGTLGPKSIDPIAG